MSTKILNGVTHAIVTIPEKAVALETGVRAVVDLCYGPGDDTAICEITLMKSEDDLVWTVPHVRSSVAPGHKVLVPVLKGQLLLKSCEVAARAVDRVKRDFGTPKYHTKYRVFAGDTKAVEEIAA